MPAKRAAPSGGVEPARARLDHHHREVVGDDVVQLAGDPRALAAHRELGDRLLLGLELAVALGELGDQLAARAHDPPGGPGRHRDQQQRHASTPAIASATASAATAARRRAATAARRRRG